MKKLILHFVILIAVFFSTWAALSRVDLIELLNIEQKTASLEEKLGELLYDLISRTEEEITDKEITAQLIHIKDTIADNNGLDADNIKLHLIRKDEINAFALPDNQIVVYTGLIKFCRNAEELAGVIGHEIAHLKNNHVMRRLGKEFGLSALISLTTGSGGQTMNEVFRLISSTAYDRNLEREADMQSVEYLRNADIDPEPFADFLFRLSLEKEAGIPRALFLLNTHPNSEERATEIIHALDEENVTGEKPLMEEEAWQALQESL